MHVFLNGRFQLAEKAVVSAFDRGFLHGDGLFEAIRIYDGMPFLWGEHLLRLRHGLDFLGIGIPFSDGELYAIAGELIKKNRTRDCLLRITISRGANENGDCPTVMLSTRSCQPNPTGRPLVWKAITTNLRLPANDPLAGFKTSNRMRQLLARTQAAEAGADEALLCNTDGFVVEGSFTNLFWIENESVHTPRLAAGVLPGTTRARILHLCGALNISTQQSEVTTERLLKTEGVFLTSCGVEIAELSHLDDQPLRRSEIVQRLFGIYRG